MEKRFSRECKSWLLPVWVDLYLLTGFLLECAAIIGKTKKKLKIFDSFSAFPNVYSSLMFDSSRTQTVAGEVASHRNIMVASAKEEVI